MSKKIAIFGFAEDPSCFIHALLNGLEMQEKGWDVKLVIEGLATKHVQSLNDPLKTFAPLYQMAKKKGLIAGVCRACAKKVGVLDSVEEQGLKLLGEMHGHPSMAGYIEQGYEIITV
ncbi:MAG: DsrE family protein [Desulfobulbaceae bacterium]|nr:DsrE family protein [Desulfobulbaceae bacterium]